jgi:hypothetical protein
MDHEYQLARRQENSTIPCPGRRRSRRVGDVRIDASHAGIHHYFQALFPGHAPQPPEPCCRIAVGPLLVERNHALQQYLTEDMRRKGAGIFADEGRQPIALFQLSVPGVLHRRAIIIGV